MQYSILQSFFTVCVFIFISIEVSIADANHIHRHRSDTDILYYTILYYWYWSLFFNFSIIIIIIIFLFFSIISIPVIWNIEWSGVFVASLNQNQSTTMTISDSFSFFILQFHIESVASVFCESPGYQQIYNLQDLGGNGSNLLSRVCWMCKIEMPPL